MMNQNNNGTAYSALQAVVYQFENWRATRGKRGKIPGALWALVAPLMEKYSHNEIASALRLNHGQLKVLEPQIQIAAWGYCHGFFGL